MKDTVIASGLELGNDEDKYTENDKQVTVYLFRSPTCNHCHDAIKFFDSIVEEYGNKFKMRSYDCQSNIDNNNLKKKVANFLEVDAPGVPLIVIGNSYFYGFEEAKIDKIKQAIDYEYAKEEKYDIIDEMNNGKKDKSASVSKIIVIVLLTVGVILFLVLNLKKS